MYKRQIENCGKGEIYIDNYNIALVERIGRDTDIRLSLIHILNPTAQARPR